MVQLSRYIPKTYVGEKMKLLIDKIKLKLLLEEKRDNIRSSIFITFWGVVKVFKYSLKDSVNKVYQHSLYQAVMGEFSPELKEDSFVLDGVSYKWMTIAEMEADDRIMEVNKDVVSFVKEKIE